MFLKNIDAIKKDAVSFQLLSKLQRMNEIITGDPQLQQLAEEYKQQWKKENAKSAQPQPEPESWISNMVFSSAKALGRDLSGEQDRAPVNTEQKTAYQDTSYALRAFATLADKSVLGTDDGSALTFDSTWKTVSTFINIINGYHTTMQNSPADPMTGDPNRTLSSRVNNYLESYCGNFRNIKSLEARVALRVGQLAAPLMDQLALIDREYAYHTLSQANLSDHNNLSEEKTFYQNTVGTHPDNQKILLSEDYYRQQVKMLETAVAQTEKLCQLSDGETDTLLKDVIDSGKSQLPGEESYRDAFLRDNEALYLLQGEKAAKEKEAELDEQNRQTAEKNKDIRRQNQATAEDKQLRDDQVRQLHSQMEPIETQLRRDIEEIRRQPDKDSYQLKQENDYQRKKQLYQESSEKYQEFNKQLQEYLTVQKARQKAASGALTVSQEHLDNMAALNEISRQSRNTYEQIYGNHGNPRDRKLPIDKLFQEKGCQGIIELATAANKLIEKGKSLDSLKYSIEDIKDAILLDRYWKSCPYAKEQALSLDKNALKSAHILNHIAQIELTAFNAMKDNRTKHAEYYNTKETLGHHADLSDTELSQKIDRLNRSVQEAHRQMDAIGKLPDEDTFQAQLEKELAALPTQAQKDEKIKALQDKANAQLRDLKDQVAILNNQVLEPLPILPDIPRSTIDMQMGTCRQAAKEKLQKDAQAYARQKYAEHFETFKESKRREFRRQQKETHDTCKKRLEEIKSMHEKHLQFCQTAKQRKDMLGDLNNQVGTVVSQGSKLPLTMLGALESMQVNMEKGTKPGHKNSQLFNDMKNSLQDAINFMVDNKVELCAGNNDIVRQLKEIYLKKVADTASTYTTAREKGIHWFPSDMHFVRLGVSKSLQKYAASATEALTSMQQQEKQLSDLKTEVQRINNDPMLGKNVPDDPGDFLSSRLQQYDVRLTAKQDDPLLNPQAESSSPGLQHHESLQNDDPAKQMQQPNNLTM